LFDVEAKWKSAEIGQICGVQVVRSTYDGLVGRIKKMALNLGFQRLLLEHVAKM